MKKIIHIVGDSQFGGGAVIILQLAKFAKINGFDVSILTTSTKLQDLALKSGITPISLDCIWRPIRPIRDTIGLVKLYKFLKLNKFDIVHTHTSKAGFIGRAAATLANVPLILHTIHGFAFHEESSRFKIIFYSALEKLASNWCNNIISVSEYHKNWALKLKIAPKEKIIAIPNGIPRLENNKTFNGNSIRRELNIPIDSTVLVSAGRLAPQKGLEYLVPAINQLIKMGHSNLHVILAGDGPIRSSLEELIKFYKLQDNFHLLGFRQDISDVLASGNIAVMPTEREGLSIALLEAMAAAKPIVTTTIGSNIEVTMAGKCAILVEPRNIEALSQAIDKLIKNPTTAIQMGLKAKNRFEELYTEDKMLKNYLRLYKSDLRHTN